MYLLSTPASYEERRNKLSLKATQKRHWIDLHFWIFGWLWCVWTLLTNNMYELCHRCSSIFFIFFFHPSRICFLTCTEWSISSQLYWNAKLIYIWIDCCYVKALRVVPKVFWDRVNFIFPSKCAVYSFKPPFLIALASFVLSKYFKKKERKKEMIIL